jgi:sensor c-di-GMP phosphodiesterase-like protein
MPAWLPLIKATLPYVAEVARLAIPAFTAKNASERPEALMQQQIAELQDAATRNAESVRTLGRQLQETITAIESAANAYQAERRRQQWLVLLSLGIGLVALGMSVAVLWMARTT